MDFLDFIYFNGFLIILRFWYSILLLSTRNFSSDIKEWSDFILVDPSKFTYAFSILFVAVVLNVKFHYFIICSMIKTITNQKETKTEWKHCQSAKSNSLVGVLFFPCFVCFYFRRRKYEVGTQQKPIAWISNIISTEKISFFVHSANIRNQMNNKTWFQFVHKHVLCIWFVYVVVLYTLQCDRVYVLVYRGEWKKNSTTGCVWDALTFTEYRKRNEINIISSFHSGAIRVRFLRRS